MLCSLYVNTAIKHMCLSDTLARVHTQRHARVQPAKPQVAPLRQTTDKPSKSLCKRFAKRFGNDSKMIRTRFANDSQELRSKESTVLALQRCPFITLLTGFFSAKRPSCSRSVPLDKVLFVLPDLWSLPVPETSRGLGVYI